VVAADPTKWQRSDFFTEERGHPRRMKFFVSFFVLVGLISSPVFGAAAGKTTKSKTRVTSSTSRKKASTARKAPVRRSRTSRYSPWKEPTYADSTQGDSVDGEDLAVRRAAVEALGPYNGTVVAVDANTGRILTIVNQKLAMKSGFQPCSTVKIPVALAALSEGLIDRNTALRIYGRTTINLTEALAKSNNQYFAQLGVKLGFERVSYYAKLFGLGEKAGLNIPDEEPGTLPSSPPKNGGMGMMCSFGEGITLTPLELASLLSSIANGGTLYYLQYPQSQTEVENFVPRVKRRLDIQQWIPEVKPGMMGAVEYGTARKAAYDPNEPILGKTGTCTDKLTPNQLVVVVLLTGGRPVNGPVAAGVAGNVYRRLSDQNYFAQERGISPVALISTQSCCAR
jgi:penicillin-binding protein 2